MSIESFSPLPLNVFGTWVTLLDPSDVPAGMSPSLGDVEFFPGGVRTRPGLASQFPVLPGTPQINGVKTYATTNLIQRFLAAEKSSAAGNPRERYARLLALHRAGERDLLTRGLDDAHAWLPPPIAKRFGRRLSKLGWIRDDAWTPYCFRLRANQK